MDFGSQDIGTGAQDQLLPDRDVLFPTQDTSLLVSAPQSTVTLFTPDLMQANTHPKITISDTELPFVRNPNLLEMYLDTFFSFNAHCVQVANRVSKKNNV